MADETRLDYKGMLVITTDHRSTASGRNYSEHVNRKEETHLFDRVWFTPSQDIHVVVAHFPFREGGSYWLTDSTSFGDTIYEDRFFDDDGPYWALEEALDALHLIAVAARLGDNDGQGGEHDKALTINQATHQLIYL